MEGGEVGKRALECILMPAMFGAKNVRAQRDRLLQLRRRLQQQQQTSPGSVSVQEVAADLFKVSSMGLKNGAGYLSSCLHLAYENDADLSFCNPALAFIPDEQLYAALFEQRFPPRPPGNRSQSQTEAFTRVELAYHAVNLAMGYHVPRCVEFLVGERPPSGTGKPDDRMVGYSDDTVAAATDHIFKTRLAGMAPRTPTTPAPRSGSRGHGPASSTVSVTKTRTTLLPPRPPGDPLRWPAARTRTRRSPTSTARAPSRASPSSTSTPPSPSSAPSSTPRRSPKSPRWPKKTRTSLRKDPIHQMSDRNGVESLCTVDRSKSSSRQSFHLSIFSSSSEFESSVVSVQLGQTDQLLLSKLNFSLVAPSA